MCSRKPNITLLFLIVLFFFNTLLSLFDLHDTLQAIQNAMMNRRFAMGTTSTMNQSFGSAASGWGTGSFS